MTEDEVFLEFLANFGDRNRDGKIQRDEWNDYYAAVSASIDNDDHFVQLMITAWKLWTRWLTCLRGMMARYLKNPAAESTYTYL